MQDVLDGRLEEESVEELRIEKEMADVASSAFDAVTASHTSSATLSPTDTPGSPG
jgi:hypothetical protein